MGATVRLILKASCGALKCMLRAYAQTIPGIILTVLPLVHQKCANWSLPQVKQLTGSTEWNLLKF